MTKNLAAAQPDVNLSKDQNSNHQVTMLRWGSTADALVQAIQECGAAGWDDAPVRVLAAKIDRCPRTVQRLLAQLVSSGRLSITRRKIGPRRNDTNVYRVIGGGGDIVSPRYLKPNTSTEASRPPATIPPKLQTENDGLKACVRWMGGKLAGAQARLDWIEPEYARLKHQVAFFRGYCQRGEQIANAKGWLSRQDEQAARMRMRAMCGYYGPPIEDQPAANGRT
jgi:hypothetical protein